MNFKELEKSWNYLGDRDPLWAILTDPEKKTQKWRADKFFGTGVAEIDSLMRYASSVGANIPRKRALDFGCGVGRLTQALADHFDEVWGVDIAASMIKSANEYNRHGNRCHYHLNQTPDLTAFPDDSFDLVCSFITLQHIEPQYSSNYLREFIRILAPHGLLIFQLPSELSPEMEAPTKFQRIKEIIKGITPRVLLNLYRHIRNDLGMLIEMHAIQKDNVVKLLEENGGRIIDISEDQRAGKGWISLQYCATKASTFG